MSELVRTSAGDLLEASAGVWLVRTRDGETSFDDLGGALRFLDLACAECDLEPLDVEFLVAMEPLLEAAEAAGCSELFTASENGWVLVDGYWLPSRSLPDYGGEFGDFSKVGRWGRLGVDVALYSWNGIYVYEESGPDCEGQRVRVLGTVTEDAARAAAADRELELLSQWGLAFADDLGLANLASSERFPLPEAATPCQRWETYTDTSDAVADMTVHRLDQSTATEQWLVTRTGDSTVVGAYLSEAELERATTVDPGLQLSVTDLGANPS